MDVTAPDELHNSFSFSYIAVQLEASLETQLVKTDRRLKTAKRFIFNIKSFCLNLLVRCVNGKSKFVKISTSLYYKIELTTPMVISKYIKQEK